MGGAGGCSAVFGKMAPPVTERGLKSVVWQSECDGAGAERGKAKEAVAPGLAFLPQTSSPLGSRGGHLLLWRPRPC